MVDCVAIYHNQLLLKGSVDCVSVDEIVDDVRNLCTIPVNDESDIALGNIVGAIGVGKSGLKFLGLVQTT